MVVKDFIFSITNRNIKYNKNVVPYLSKLNRKELIDIYNFIAQSQKIFGKFVNLHIELRHDEDQFCLIYSTREYTDNVFNSVDYIMQQYPQELTNSNIWIPILTDFAPIDYILEFEECHLSLN